MGHSLKEFDLRILVGPLQLLIFCGGTNIGKMEVTGIG